jgi:hypothetical protein
MFPHAGCYAVPAGGPSVLALSFLMQSGEITGAMCREAAMAGGYTYFVTHNRDGCWAGARTQNPGCDLIWAVHGGAIILKTVTIPSSLAYAGCGCIRK